MSIVLTKLTQHVVLPCACSLLMCLAEAYDILHVLGGLSNDEIATVFAEWNSGELQVRGGRLLTRTVLSCTCTPRLFLPGSPFRRS
jgi:hypothetical protein